MTDEKYGVIQFAKTDAQKKSTQAVSDGYQSVVSHGKNSKVDWPSLRHAANAAALAANAAAYAANAANAADAADAAKRKEWTIAQSDKLIELLKAAALEGKE